MNTLITTSRASDIYAKIENPMTAIAELGKMFHQSGIMGVTNPGDGAVIALTCMCEGITPLEFARTYHIIEGKPSMRADMMSAKFREAGGKVKWINLGDDGKAAEAEFTHDGQSLTIKYTIDDAKAVVGDKLDKPNSNWKKDRGAMLRARLITKAIRIIAPEIIAGVYTPDEIEESSTTPVVETAKKKTQAERKKELEADAVVTTTVMPETVAIVTGEIVSTYNDETRVDESPPFETGDTVATLSELQALAAAGQGAKFSIQEINDAMCKVYEVTSVKEAKSSQVAAMTSKFKLLSEAITLGAKYPSQVDKSKGMDREEIFATLCKKCEVDAVWKIEDQRIQNLINAFRKHLGG